MVVRVQPIQWCWLVYHLKTTKMMMTMNICFFFSFCFHVSHIRFSLSSENFSASVKYSLAWIELLNFECHILLANILTKIYWDAQTCICVIRIYVYCYTIHSIFFDFNILGFFIPIESCVQRLHAIQTQTHTQHQYSCICYLYFCISLMYQSYICVYCILYMIRCI